MLQTYNPVPFHGKYLSMIFLMVNIYRCVLLMILIQLCLFTQTFYRYHTVTVEFKHGFYFHCSL
jgi:hypothetical protein